jgi:hypothetical protein
VHQVRAVQVVASQFLTFTAPLRFLCHLHVCSVVSHIRCLTAVLGCSVCLETHLLRIFAHIFARFCCLSPGASGCVFHIRLSSVPLREDRKRSYEQAFKHPGSTFLAVKFLAVSDSSYCYRREIIAIISRNHKFFFDFAIFLLETCSLPFSSAF